MKNVSENIKESNIQLQTGLPNNWELVSLGSIVKTITYGHTASSTYEPVGPKFLRITDIQKDQVQWGDVPYCKCENIEKYKLKRGDIVIARTGATTGKNYLLEHLPESTVFASYLIRLETFEEPAPKYLSLYMKSQSYWQQITTVSKGSAQPGANASVLSKLTVPIAPIQQQTRIVTAIESLQQRSAKARTLLTEVEPLIDKLRQSILQSAFSGRLTADWRAKNPDVEPADQLLARIRVERRQRWEDAELAKFEAKGKTPSKGWRDKYKEPEPVDESGLPELPEGWCWCQANDLIETIDAGRSPTALSRPAEPGEAAVLKVSAISWREFDPLANKALKRGDEIGDTPTPKKGDLIISRANTVELVGAIVLVKDDYPNLMLSDKTLRLNLTSEEIVTEFFLYSFRTEFVRESFEANATGTSNSMRNLSQGKILDALIPLPPVMEQQLIADKLVANEGACGEICRTLSELKSSLAQLDRSILSKAFRGELVPQDPNNEPASELLARIQATREAETLVKKASKKKATRKKKKASP